MKVRIEVTQDDIDSGDPGDACSCPVAIALGRVLSVPVPAVDLYGIWSTNEQRLTEAADVADLPGDARDFINAYDDGLPVAPFAFDLDVPDDLVRQP